MALKELTIEFETNRDLRIAAETELSDMSAEINRAESDVEQVADAARQSFEEPHVRARACQFDVAETFAAHTGERDFHTTLVANDAAMLHALVLSAQAFPVRDGTEDACAEEAVTFRLKGAVVDGFGLGNFAV